MESGKEKRERREGREAGDKVLIGHIYTCEVNSQANLNKIAAKNTGYLAFRLRMQLDGL